MVIAHKIGAHSRVHRTCAVTLCNVGFGFVMISRTFASWSSIKQSIGPIQRDFYSKCSKTKPFPDYDLVIVGGGIIGLATARHISIRYPKLRLCLVEKEHQLCRHQSTHNSGVIHTGIYYTPGSLKAQLCVEGMNKAYAYFEEKGIPYKKCGKLIIAVTERELREIDNLYQRAIQNKAPGVSVIEGNNIPSIEPACRGLKAIYSPNTGIVDWGKVALSFADDFIRNRGVVELRFEVCVISENCTSSDFPILVKGKSGGIIACKYLISCAGLQSDRVASLTGGQRSPKIIPFRGEYLRLKQEKSSLVSTNIYPVPDPLFPFLGVHFTPRMDGSVWLGPTALLSCHREGYHPIFNFSMKDTLDFLCYPGLHRLAIRYARFGLTEITRTVFMSQQVKQLQRYVPSLTMNDVERYTSGIRAQALSEDGKLVDDFVFEVGGGGKGFQSRVFHVKNAPSPGATSSMAIARVVCEHATKKFGISALNQSY